MKLADGKKKPAGLPRGREGAALKIDLPFEDALRAILEIQPERRRTKSKKRRRSG